MATAGAEEQAIMEETEMDDYNPNNSIATDEEGNPLSSDFDLTANEVGDLEDLKVKNNEISRNIDRLNKSLPKSVKTLGAFLISNSVIAVILNVIAIVFTKAKPKSDAKKMAVVRALLNLMETTQSAGEKVLKWVQDNKDQTVTLEGAVTKTIPELFKNYTDSITAAGENAETYAKKLKTGTDKDGTAKYVFPDEATILAIFDQQTAVVNALVDFKDFMQTKKTLSKVMRTMPLDTAEIAGMQTQLANVKAMPWE